MSRLAARKLTNEESVRTCAQSAALEIRAVTMGRGRGRRRRRRRSCWACSSVLCLAQLSSAQSLAALKSYMQVASRVGFKKKESVYIYICMYLPDLAMGLVRYMHVDPHLSCLGDSDLDTCCISPAELKTPSSARRRPRRRRKVTHRTSSLGV